MSRFFAASDSSSDESSEEELYSNGEESEQDDSDKDSDADDSDDSDSSSGSETGGANRFLKDVSSDSESDEGDDNKVLKSAKDKRFDELEATVRQIENAQKINDWAVISDQFDKLNRQVPTLVKQNDGKVPKFYIQAIADLETIVLETHEKQKVTPKKMNAVNTRGFNAVRQKVKKHNRDYQRDIDTYRENKEDFMREVEEVEQAPKEKKKKVKIAQLGADTVEEGNDDGFVTVGAGGKAVLYTPEGILKHLRSIVEQRGRKNTDRLEHIRTLEKLFDVAVNDYQRVRVLLTLISTRFDLTSGTASHMTQEQWKLADQEFGKLLQILEGTKEIVVVENAEEWEDDEKLPNITPEDIFRIPGSVVSFVERLDDELTRSLQHIDPHTAEYVERLGDEGLLYSQLVRTLIYVESLKKIASLEFPQDPINRIVMRRLEHVYFKPSQVVTILESNTWKSMPENLDSEITPRAVANDTASLVQTLCTYLFQHSEGIIRARAMLCQIYFLALHDQYYQARDMMLMSHLQETISNFDVNTQILFNRSLVQVGLCAFRAGLVYEAQTSLQEICGSNRQKELLAQGLQMQRYSQISPEQERLERQRQLPFHLHINLELLECVYLTCSMLLEIPLLAQLGSSPDLRKRVISKTYRRLLEYHERQIFTGPPENTRDHVMQASKALSAGEWKKAAEFINSIKIWELMADSEKIQAMLSAQIQEEGLRTYLFTYAPYYDTLAVSTLAGMFELPERKVSAVVSKMISHEELGAALDQVNSAIIFRKGVELSRLQTLALSLSDKASGLIESNEKTLEQRTQGTANAFERQGGRGGRGGGRGGRGGRGGGRGGGDGGPRGGRNQQFTGGALGRAIQA
ncbi:eukaryotic translation initiation factor 3 subunit C [Dothidotthia symphoricarpi CBS 119687]|uniref:Eukaryotic translation initiation factor 3 subunit C n=1 Tax=Dothidotthia symphoricarpi CBS 119687 TaxID=1392245 RepID=A0A6A6AP40_9PLEO|nr:eukaryotic translation initiation factor 3 subunit C [Dothidotthia symphoricarpi CBS 119687]KAF2133560.1 eukaryotic translation initiation factor 3 subunit C [Dothidotthia symphoricarpi CBS 119687]